MNKLLALSSFVVFLVLAKTPKRPFSCNFRAFWRKKKKRKGEATKEEEKPKEQKKNKQTRRRYPRRRRRRRVTCPKKRRERKHKEEGYERKRETKSDKNANNYEEKLEPKFVSYSVSLRKRLSRIQRRGRRWTKRRHSRAHTHTEQQKQHNLQVLLPK